MSAPKKTAPAAAPAARDAEDLATFLAIVAPFVTQIRRDFNASLAMQAWVSAGAFNELAEDMFRRAGITDSVEKERMIADIAYAMADHMEAARAKTGGAR